MNEKIVLPAAPGAVSKLYKPFILEKRGRWGGISGQVYLEGKGPATKAGLTDAQKTARQVGLYICAQIADACGGEECVQGWFVQLFELGVFVYSEDGFQKTPEVADGASQVVKDWLMQCGVAEEDAYGMRAAVSTNGLPRGVAVEVTARFKVRWPE